MGSPLGIEPTDRTIPGRVNIELHLHLGLNACHSLSFLINVCPNPTPVKGARCSSVVRAFAHGAMGRRIDPSWGGPIELFLVPASAPRLV